jgi:signal transduction histidine kinase
MDNGLLLQYVVICLNLAAAFLVLADNPKNALNRSFFIFAFGAAMWIFCTDMVYFGKNSAFFRPMLCCVEIMVLGFVFLANFFPDGVKDGGKIKKEFLLFLLPWLIVSAFTFSQLVIRFADINHDGYLEATSGVLFLVRFVVMLWYVAWSISTFFRKYLKLAPAARTRFFPFIASAGLFITATLVCDFFLFVPHVPYFVFVSSLFSLVFVGYTAYAIVRHRLMDIRLVVQRGSVYAIAIFIIALFYFGGSFMLQEFLYENDTLAHPISGVSAAVLCVFGFLCLKREFEEVTDKFFFRGEYDYFATVHQLGEIFCSKINLNDLLGSIGEVFSRTIKPEKIIFFLDDAKHPSFFDGILRNPLPADAENGYKELIDNFRAFSPNPLFIKELERTIKDVRPGRRRKYQFCIVAAKKMHIAAIIPIFLKEETSAILLLGGKRSGTAFSQKDNELLSVISHQAGMAIENAMLYAALRRHAEELERRVHERTERIKNMYDGQSRFLADLSHEFQTPISILKGNVERLEKINNTKGRGEFYTIETTLDRLSRLVDNLLGIARLNFSKTNLEKRRMNVEKLLEQTYDDCLILARDKGIKLSFSSEKCFVFGSVDKLKEVLLNLISNALRHTLPGGAISISAKIIDDEIEIAVTDTGSGISHKNLPRVFERFYKIDGSGLGGTGLGLYICRQIIEAHGGTITVKSAPGEGSRFVIRLPLPPHDSEKFAIL